MKALLHFPQPMHVSLIKPSFNESMYIFTCLIKNLLDFLTAVERIRAFAMEVKLQNYREKTRITI